MKTASLKKEAVTDAPDSEKDNLLGDVAAGLESSPPRLPSKFFYDAEGSRLFDEICRTPDYYPTRTERQILLDRKEEICRAIGSRAVLIEPGCGSCEKTRIILEHHPELSAFVPIDISAEYLDVVAGKLRTEFPDLPILPLAADFMNPFELPPLPDEHARKTVFYPGSTLGNFLPQRAKSFLAQMAKLIGPGGALILGLDQIKDKEILERAYNDSQGYTAAFNLNMLHHINEKAGRTLFNPDGFRHRAVWNEPLKRIEMHLVSVQHQKTAVLGKIFEFNTDDYIVTEYSHKYNDEMVEHLVEGLFRVKNCWKDEKNLFGLYYLEAV